MKATGNSSYVRPSRTRPVWCLRVPPHCLRKGHMLRTALATDIYNPVAKHRSGVGPAFSADDHPIDSAEIQQSNVGQQRLNREKPDACRRVLERTNAREAVTPILHADAVRDVAQFSHPLKLARQQYSHPCVPLGEDLENVPMGAPHDVAHISDEIGRNRLVKEVAHRVDEDFPRSPPVQRLLKFLRDQPQIEALLEWVSRHTPKPFREHLCIAVLAARTNLRAPAHRVPGGICPLDRRTLAH